MTVWAPHPPWACCHRCGSRKYALSDFRGKPLTSFGKPAAKCSQCDFVSHRLWKTLKSANLVIVKDDEEERKIIGKLIAKRKALRLTPTALAGLMRIDVRVVRSMEKLKDDRIRLCYLRAYAKAVNLKLTISLE